MCPELDFKEVNEVIAMGSDHTNALSISPAVPRIIMDLGDRFLAICPEIYVLGIFVCCLYFLFSM